MKMCCLSSHRELVARVLETAFAIISEYAETQGTICAFDLKKYFRSLGEASIDYSGQYYDHQESRQMQPPAPPKLPKPPIAPGKAQRIAEWSMAVPNADEHSRSAMSNSRLQGQGYLAAEYAAYEQGLPPPEDGPRLLRSAMKGGRAAYSPRTSPSESLDDIIDPFEPATAGVDAARLYGGWVRG